MTAISNRSTHDHEVSAVSVMVDALNALEPDQQQRILRYLGDRFMLRNKWPNKPVFGVNSTIERNKR